MIWAFTTALSNLLYLGSRDFNPKYRVENPSLDVEKPVILRELPSNLFVLDPANVAFIRKRAGNLAIHESSGETSLLSALFFLPIALLGAFLAYSALLSLVTIVQLQTLGVSTVASVTGCEINNGKEITYYVHYQFTASGSQQIYEGERKTPYTCTHLQLGSLIDITYLPDDPGAKVATTNLLEGIFAIFASTIMVLLGSRFIKHAIYTYRRIQRLQREGVLLPGHILKGELEHGRQTWFHLSYQFITPNGDLITGKVSRIRKDLSRVNMPHRDRPIVVLFADNTCYKIL